MNGFWSHFNTDITKFKPFWCSLIDTSKRVSRRSCYLAKFDIQCDWTWRAKNIYPREIEDDRTFKPTISVTHNYPFCHENFTTTEQIKKLQKSYELSQQNTCCDVKYFFPCILFRSCRFSTALGVGQGNQLTLSHRATWALVWAGYQNSIEI